MPEAPEIAPLASESLAVIVGPTASGKTELALALARALGGEIISADSRQVYRGVDAGTAKPAPSEIPVHIIDCAEPSEPFDAGRFAVMAREALKDIRSRGKFPIVAGGTGLYVKALLHGLAPMPPRDEAVRRRILAEGNLRERLAAVDPEASLRIPANNVQRLVRALEVHELTGRPISSFWSAEEPPAFPEARVLSIQWPAETLRERIFVRARAMWPRILTEVQRLSKKYNGQEPGFQSLGYPEAFACLRGQMTEAAGLESLCRSTLAYAKRQRTWFRHQIKAVPIEGGDLDGMLRRALEIIGTHEARIA